MKHYFLLITLFIVSYSSLAQHGQTGIKKNTQFETAKTKFLAQDYEYVIEYCDSFMNTGLTDLITYKLAAESYIELAKQNKKDSIRFIDKSKKAYDLAVKYFGKMQVEEKWDTITIDASSQELKSYQRVDQDPKFPGGNTAMHKYIQKEFTHPKEAKKQNVHGRIFLKFVVNKDGSVDAVNILRGGGEKTLGCDKEAIRVIKNLPKFEPGIYNGEPTYCSFVLPLTY